MFLKILLIVSIMTAALTPFAWICGYEWQLALMVSSSYLALQKLKSMFIALRMWIE
jgi:nucleoside permease NupC